MSTALVVGTRDSFLEKILESLTAEGLNIVSSEATVKDLDYILYSTLREEHGNTAWHIYKLRDRALEDKARLVVLSLDSRKTRGELKRSAQNLDERHVYFSNSSPQFSEELWKDLKRLVFSPSHKNSSIHLTTQEAPFTRIDKEMVKDKPLPVVKEQPEKEKALYPPTNNRSRRGRESWISLMFITLVVLFTLALPFIELKVGEYLLGQKGADKISKVAENLLAGAQNGFALYKDIPYVGRFFNSREARSRQLRNLARILQNHQKATETARNLVAGFFSYDEPILAEQIISTRGEFDKISSELDLLAAAAGLDSSRLGIEEMRKKAKGFSSLLGYLQVVGESREVSELLILLTDASQLRGSGGVVVGYGLLKFQAGKVDGFQTFLSEEIDSKLKGEVMPPALLKKYLSQDVWYFKDSTWSPDFESASARALWFLEKTTGKKPSGVVSIDTEFLREFGRARGVVVGDFYNLVQSRGGSFVLEKADEVYESLTGNPKQGLEALSSVVFESLEEKHVLLKTGDLNFSGITGELGWSGVIREEYCLNKEECADDYLQVVSANLNGSRQGFRIARDYKLEIKIGKESISHKLTIQREGAAGDLKDYLRVYVPLNSEMGEPVLLNAETGAQEKLKVDKAQESMKTVYGFSLEVPKGQKREVVLNWSTALPQGINLKQYNLVWQKQPGAIEGAALLSVQYQDARTPQYFLTPGGRALTRRGSLLYNTQLTQDMTLRLLFAN